MDLDNVKKAVGDIAQKMVKKSGDVVELSKVKYGIYETQSNINKIFTEIGKSLYDSYKTGDVTHDDFKENCELIDEKKAEIEMLEERLMILKSTKKCNGCGKQVVKDAAFCPICGEKF